MSIPTEAIEEAADIIWMRANGENGVCGTDRKTHSYAVATEVAAAALTAASPAIQAAALRDAADAAFKDKSIQGLQRTLVGTWLRARAELIEGKTK